MNTQMIISELYKLFDALNEHYWKNELPTVFFTLKQGASKTKSVYGTFYPDSYAKKPDLPEGENLSGEENMEAVCDEVYHEISMGAEFLSRPFPSVAATLQHEMCHLYAQIYDIKDTSRNGAFHNTKFRDIAEKHGLVIDKDPKNGWTLTDYTPGFEKFVTNLDLDYSVFDYFRLIKTGTSTKTASVKRWICPICAQTINAKKTASLACGNCMKHLDYWDMTDEDMPVLLGDYNEGLAKSEDGWYGRMFDEDSD